MYNPLLDDSQFHNDEVTVIGESGLDRINYVRIDYEKAAARNRGTDGCKQAAQKI